MSEHKEKLPAEEITKVETALTAAKKIFEENKADAVELEKTYQELMTSSHKLAEIMYKAGAEASSTEESSQNNSSSDEPIEPEITK